MSHAIAFLIYPDFQILDIAGPIAAFEIAARFQPDAYAPRLIAAKPGAVASSSGFSMFAQRLPSAATMGTLIIAGGDGSRSAAACPRTLQFIRACVEQGRRVASVCSGTYLLAAAGVLDGKPATTHWSRAQDLQAKYPRVRLDAERIFVKSGKVWTSAGITAGIDLALALIGEDLGDRIARRTAQQMVVYHRRPGGQSQFSPLLELEPATDRFAETLDFMRANLRKRLTVAQLAAHANMSSRHFAREFRAATGVTPAKALEGLRADAARAALESGKRSIQHVARACGFGATERMRRTFLRRYGVPPAALKRRLVLSG